jgi:murein DD-endopeptidase MepM/ murein hydrolase activator NlpD
MDDAMASLAQILVGLAGGALGWWALAGRRREDDKPEAPTVPPTPTPTDPTPPARDVFGVPFAAGAAAPLWPLPGDRRGHVGTTWARGRVTTDFGDPRPFGATTPTRHHAGEDLRAPRYSELVATERGRIVSIDEDWYDAASGAATGAVLVETDTGIVINYGEVEPGSTKARGLNVGSVVERGDVLALVGATNMVHLETYAPGTKRTWRWPWHGVPPVALLDPTRYLERAAKTVPP